MPDQLAVKAETAKRIRTLRKSREIPLHKLAQDVGISTGYLSEVERGLSEISGLKLARLAEHLGVTSDYLLTGRTSEGKSESVRIPPELSEAAKTLDLTYLQTIRLLAGKESLRAHRSQEAEKPWTKEDWVEFFRKVKPYL